MAKRLMIIGLDCVPPKFLFDRFRAVMPVVANLIEEGAYGPLRSSIPPITVPAWTCMVSGKDPGELGLYGFRNRLHRSYEWTLPTSKDVRTKRLWDWAGDAGKKCAALFVPLTYPASPMRGQMVSGFLAPGATSDWAFPKNLREELENADLPFIADVADFRTRTDEAVLAALFEMADAHFATAKYVWDTKSPDFMMMVEIGPDRFHHAFYQHLDPQDPKHDPDHPMVQDAFRYYAHLDQRIGELLEKRGPDTAVMIVSDHGARPMEGGVAINQWLIEQGYLTLKPAHEPGPLNLAAVDWSKTLAWGAGGYYGRVFLNVNGREPEGQLAAAEVESFAKKLAGELRSIRGFGDRELNTVIHRPPDTYQATRGTPPDLMVFFDNLRFRSLGSVGGAVLQEADDRGRDQCNHDWDGVFVLAGAEAKGELQDLSIYDVTKTALGVLGIKPPMNILGQDRSRG